jgi:gamma-glutamyltranspeptidase/glutathione hydrolase
MPLRSTLRPNKDEVIAKNGIVTAMQRLPAEAGLKMLKQDGNAVDAGVAIGFCNTVVEAHMGGIAGQGSMLIHSVNEDRTVSIDFSSRSPRKASLGMYNITRVSREPRTNMVYEVENNENKEGVKAFTVPGTVAGLCLAHEIYGNLPLEFVMAPAISLASSGFMVNWDLTLYIAEKMDWLRSRPILAKIWIPNGRPPLSYRENVVQPRLGKLLKNISSEGPKAFYSGPYANAIVEKSEADGGVLTKEDLADYEAKADEPLSVTYRNYQILTPSAPTGGPTTLETLKILENFDLESLGHNTNEYLHVFIECARHAFADRYSYLGDWDVSSVPLKGMLSEDYAREIANQIDVEKAHLEGDLTEEPWVYYLTHSAHDPWKFDLNPRPPSPSKGASFSSSTAGGTTHFNATDKDGNFICCTHYGGWGSGGCITTGNGEFIGGDMYKFIPKEGYVNTVEGWKRPLCNDAPIIVLKDGVPVLCEGAPGSRRIINRVTQIVLNVIDFGMSIQVAHSMPTVDASTRNTFIDSRIPKNVISNLKARGHNVGVLEMAPGTPSHFARPSGILRDVSSGLFHGGVEVFRSAVALGL